MVSRPPLLQPLGRIDTMNLTQWREGAKGAKMRLYCAVIPDLSPVIPAKAGIQAVAIKLAIQNQARIKPADPLSLHGLTGLGLDFRRSGGHRNLWDAGKGEPSQPSETKYE